MNAGRLNKRATFQARDRTPNGAGGYSETWVDKFIVWVNLRGLSPQHREFAGQSGTFIPTWFIMRKDSGRTPQPHMRLIVDSKPYNVLVVREYTPDTKFWEVEAMEIAP